MRTKELVNTKKQRERWQFVIWYSTKTKELINTKKKEKAFNKNKITDYLKTRWQFVHEHITMQIQHREDTIYAKHMHDLQNN